MAADGSFLVEDFLGAITAQLDRTQDALAVKALNRPLTYAIKDFSLELKVFVDVDPEGRVRFRSPGANESGASTVSIGFTTVTRPMIEENTVDLKAAGAPTLAHAGLSEAERRSLERIGVRTTADLARLRQSAGTEGVSRMSDVPIDRLRQALSLGRPQVSAVRPVAPAPAAPVTQPAPPGSPPKGSTRPLPRKAGPSPRVVTLPPASRKIELTGRNLLGPVGVAPSVRLGGLPLTVSEAADGRIVVDLPADAAAGTLEIDHGDGEPPVSYELTSSDPWAP